MGYCSILSLTVCLVPEGFADVLELSQRSSGGQEREVEPESALQKQSFGRCMVYGQRISIDSHRPIDHALG